MCSRPWHGSCCISCGIVVREDTIDLRTILCIPRVRDRSSVILGVLRVDLGIENFAALRFCALEESGVTSAKNRNYWQSKDPDDVPAVTAHLLHHELNSGGG